jgi:hypothetical protein
MVWYKWTGVNYSTQCQYGSISLLPCSLLESTGTWAQDACGVFKSARVGEEAGQASWFSPAYESCDSTSGVTNQSTFTGHSVGADDFVALGTGDVESLRHSMWYRMLWSFGHLLLAEE